MKATLRITLLLILSLLWSSYSFGTDTHSYTDLKPENQHRRVSQVILSLLDRSHYKHLELDDSLSSQLLDRYLETLDFNRRYFLASDIQEFERFRYFFDDFLRTGNLDVAYAMYNRFNRRLHERTVYVKNLLKTEFNFAEKEYYEPDRQNKPWAKTSAQLDSIWRKQIKNEALNLKLAGKSWENTVEILDKRYTSLRKRMEQSQSEDVFQLFMNAFASSIDPHTNYFSPKAKEDFNIHMSRSLEGIGASLRTEDDYTKVIEIIPGGPADQDGRLHPNDKIIAVGQGESEEMVDVIGWRIDDVVQLIRGPKKTVVRLQVLKADAGPADQAVEIKIVRDKVRLEDQTAKSDTLRIDDNGKTYALGIITIPAFYFDYEGYRKRDPNYKSTTRDVELLLKELQSAGVDGIIIDLRRNGGGFLSEAVSLTGLFIKDGPVVQVRNSEGQINIEEDHDPDVVYDGPLAVLVDQFSASASEIFAAAIQDYERGIIIGNQTFGKGTVQNAVDLDRFFPRSKKKYGQLKLTIAKFYRVSGGSTQHVGVIPDITLPSRFDHQEVGESSQKNALLWDQITPASIFTYREINPGMFEHLKSRHALRVANDDDFKAFESEIVEYKKAREKKRISLNEAERRKERENSAQEEYKEDDEDGENKNDDDLLLTESAYILGDYIALTR